MKNVFPNNFSGTKLSDFLKTHSLSSDEVLFENDSRIFQEIQEISDNESEKSFSDLINDYTSSRCKNATGSKSNPKNDQISTSDDDSFEKIDMSDVLPNKKPVNLLDEPLKLCTTKDLMSSESQTNLCQDTVDRNIVKQKYTRKKLKEIDKTAFKRSDSVKTEGSLSLVSSLVLEDFDENLVLPQEMVVKWAVQLLLALEKLHTLGVICR